MFVCVQLKVENCWLVGDRYRATAIVCSCGRHGLQLQMWPYAINAHTHTQTQPHSPVILYYDDRNMGAHGLSKSSRRVHDERPQPERMRNGSARVVPARLISACGCVGASDARRIIRPNNFMFIKFFCLLVRSFVTAPVI